MKKRHVHYFELKKGDSYMLYEQENLLDKDSPIIIGDEREVKIEISKLPKDTIMSYYDLKSVDLSKSEVKFAFKKLRTIYPKSK